MRTHETTEVIDMLMDTRDVLEQRSYTDAPIVVAAGFLMRVKSEIKQLEQIALQAVKLTKNVDSEGYIYSHEDMVILRDLAEKWDNWQ